MAARNTREGATGTGITPQVHGDVLADKLNREAASAVSELQKKVQAALPRDPEEGEAPASTELHALRAVGYGWPYVTSAIAVSSGETEIPGSGMGLGTIYKGERVECFVQLGGQITSSGATYLRLVATGNTGQGSPDAVVGEAKPSLPNLAAGNGFWAGLVAVAPGLVQGARLRIFAGSSGGTLTIPLNTQLVQRFAVYTPIRKAAS